MALRIKGVWTLVGGGVVTWAGVSCVSGERAAGGSVGGDLRDLRLGRLVGGLDEHGLRELLAGGHRHLLDLIELLQYTHTHTSRRGETSAARRPPQGSLRYVLNCWLPGRQ